MKSLYFFFLLLLCITLGLRESSRAQSQPVTNDCIGGTLYYIAYPDTTTNTQDGRFPDHEPEDFVLMLYSDVDQQITIGRAGGAGLAVQLRAGEMIEWDTRRVAVPLVTTSNSVDRGKVLEIRADFPVVVYAYMTSTFGSSGFTPLPVGAWGREYYAAAWPGEVIRNIYLFNEVAYDASEKKEAPATILIIAAEDDTRVRIDTTGRLAQCNNCTTVTLNQGDAYQVHSYVDIAPNAGDQEDIAGTRISANKPIGVISGNTRTPIDPMDFPMLAGNSVQDQTAEWLLPVGMHGTEFVYTPTFDKLRQDVGGEPIRQAENIRVIAGDTTTGLVAEERDATGAVSDRARRFTLAQGEFYNSRFTSLKEGRLVTTDRPAQAFHAINSVAEFNGTTGSGNFIGASFKAWGSAMVTMVPRERWSSFAPFRVPTNLSLMSNFVTVITDTAHRDEIYLRADDAPATKVSFTETIDGSDLVWTFLPVNPGISYRLFGENGARFTGHLYGLFEDGFELYRPGGAKEDGKGRDPAAAHPSEYEENVGQAYAMPFPVTLCTNEEPRTFKVEMVEQDCAGATFRITAGGEELGLRALGLNRDDSENARLLLKSPDSFAQFDTAVSGEFTILHLDPLKDVSTEILLRDRTLEAEVLRVSYSYEVMPELLVSEPTRLDFGSIDESTDRSVQFINRFPHPIDVNEIFLRNKEQGFSLRGTLWSNPQSPYRMQPGDTVTILLRFDEEKRGEFSDVLFIRTGCGLVETEVTVEADLEPGCLALDDLDFGGRRPGESKTLPLEICNRGGGVVRFNDESDPVVAGLLSSFAISQDDIDRLRSVELRRDECLTIDVTFTAGDTFGLYETTLRLLPETPTSSGPCAGRSVLSARVGTSSVNDRAEQNGGLMITSLSPNPSNGLVSIEYGTEGAAITDVTLLDATGRAREVDLRHHGHGRITLDAAALPSGLYFVRIRDGENEAVQSVTIVR